MVWSISHPLSSSSPLLSSLDPKFNPSSSRFSTTTTTFSSLQWRRSLELQTLASHVSSLHHHRRFPSSPFFSSFLIPSFLFLCSFRFTSFPTSDPASTSSASPSVDPSLRNRLSAVPTPPRTRPRSPETLFEHHAAFWINSVIKSLRRCSSPRLSAAREVESTCTKGDASVPAEASKKCLLNLSDGYLFIRNMKKKKRLSK